MDYSNTTWSPYTGDISLAQDIADSENMVSEAVAVGAGVATLALAIGAALYYARGKEARRTDTDSFVHA